MSRSTRHRRRALGAIAAATALLGATASAAAAQDLEVVADGLANPRGLTVDPNGSLYVAEAGSGGTGPCRPSPEGGEPECLGASGAITAVDPATGAKRTVVGGLPSLAAANGEGATGPHDVSFRNGRPWFVIGLGGTPEDRAALGDGARNLGWTLRIDKRGKVVRVADLTAYEAAKDPDAAVPGSDGVDSNPFSIDATHGKPIVTDAGGNDLLSVTAGGKVKTLAVFDFATAPAPAGIPGLPEGTPLPVQPVPTGVVRGPDHAAYLGNLTGFPFAPGLAKVRRVLSNHAPTVVVEGLTNVIDVAFGPDGTLYVLQISATGLFADGGHPGKLLRIGAGGSRVELAAGQLTSPTGLAVSTQGDIYVSDHGTSATEGRIVRVASAQTT